MPERYPDSLYELLGVSEEEGLRAIRESNLTGYQINILYKRWGDTFDGKNRDPKDRMLSNEVRDLAQIILPELRSKVVLHQKANINPVIIEHEEEVNKYLGERRIIENYIAECFPEYNINKVRTLINGLMIGNSLNFNSYNDLKNFVQKNKDFILTKIKEADIEKIENKAKILNQEDLLFKILTNIRDKYFAVCSLEELIKATKVAMLRSEIKSYDNCIMLLSYLLENRFSVFRVLKTGLNERANSIITTALYVTDEEKHQFLDTDQLIESYYNGLESGYSKEDTINILAEHFKISKKLIIEILEYQIPDFKLTSGIGRD